MFIITTYNMHVCMHIDVMDTLFDNDCRLYRVYNKKGNRTLECSSVPNI